jgi:DNA-binding MurR/RpiR family transcriptional regulator
MAKLYESRDWLYNRYVVQRKNIVEIAKEAGCSHMTIQRYLEKFGLIRKR